MTKQAAASISIKKIEAESQHLRLSPMTRHNMPDQPCPHTPGIVEKKGQDFQPMSRYRHWADRCIECRLILSGIDAVASVRDEEACEVDLRKDLIDTEIWLKGPEYMWKNASDIDNKDGFRIRRRSRDKHLYKEEETSGPLSYFLPCLDIAPDSSTQFAFERCAAWLAYCVDHDKGCQPPFPFAPRRLIDVGLPDGTREPVLVETTSPVPYAALSYCWGPDTRDVLKTTTKNLQAHQSAIPLASMPAAIQDAVCLCRGIKIRYLWVDSLCIVQDDMQLWLADAVLMDKTYQCAHLAIAVLEPATCKIHFLGPQEFGTPGWVATARTIAGGKNEPDAYPSEVHVWRQRNVEATSPLQGNPASLDLRGWTFQESLLPSRRLCFDGKEMSWMCHSRSICECGHVRDPPMDLMIASDLGASVKGMVAGASLWETYYPRHARTEWQALFPRPEYRIWWAVVRHYSDRATTRRADKLRGISGLATIFRDQVLSRVDDGQSDQYAAGLWLREFHLDLAWASRDPVPTCTKGTPSMPWRFSEGPADLCVCPPSWSWASLNGGVIRHFFEQWHGPTFAVSEACHVERFTCRLEDPANNTGAVVAGIACAELTSALLSVDFSVRYNDTGTMADGCMRPKGAETEPEYVVIDAVWPVTTVESRGTDDDEYFAFRLFSVRSVRKKAEAPVMGSKSLQPTDTWFLVLQRSFFPDGAFERIGIGMTKNTCWFQEAPTTTITLV